MKRLSVLFACLVMLGCGAGSGNKGPDPILVAQFPVTPSISELSPANVPVNSVPFVLTVNGSDFGTDALVFWNGVPQSTMFVTSKQLIVQVTTADLEFAGLVPVYVRRQGATSNTVDFDVTIQ